MDHKLQAWCYGSLVAACLAACAQTKPIKQGPVYLTLPVVNEPDLADKQPPPPRPIVVTVRPDSPSKPTDIAQRSTAKAKSKAANLEDGAGGAGDDKCDLPSAPPGASPPGQPLAPAEVSSPSNGADKRQTAGKDAPAAVLKSPAVVIKQPLPVKFHYELRQQRICTPQGCRIVQQWVKVYDP